MSTLFSPIQVGPASLSHRIVMAPLTRFRASAAHVHGPLAAEYYAQRASAPGTLLITEATFISPHASGYSHVPGIYNEAQIFGWKAVTDAVHVRGSFIFCQLWALGRTADKEIVRQEAGEEWFASSSAVAMEGGEVPRQLTEEQIWALVGDYVQAGKNAIEAGFDGVEIHGANGYLIDQFTQDVVNRRTDSWGGSIPSRSRFALEVVHAVSAALGPSRVAIRLSPFSTFQSMKMANPVPQFSYLIKAIAPLGLAYVHLVESRISGNAEVEATEKVDFALDILHGDNATPVLLAGGFTPAAAKRAVEEEYPRRKLLIVFGRSFISNPDLVFRIKHGVDLAKYDRSTFYAKESPRGYVDYPFSEDYEREKKAGGEKL